MENSESKSNGWFLGLILLYNTLILLGLVFLSPMLLPLIGLREKRRRTFGRRMGLGRTPWKTATDGSSSQRIWIHALSVGEVMSAQFFTNRLRAMHPEAELYFSASTLSGYQTACRLFADAPIQVCYFPYDCIWAVRKACAAIEPTQVIIIETDIWPIFLWEMKRRKVPVHLVNLRLSDRTWRNLKRFRWIAGWIYSSFELVCVQTPDEMKRLMVLGVPSERISVTGNLKFDSGELGAPALPIILQEVMPAPADDLPLIVAGSTHEGEEAVLYGALKSILASHRRVSLVVAPRDPGRSRSVLELGLKHGLRCHRLSSLGINSGGEFPQVVIVDSIGLLKELYSLAYLAFVGGSLVPQGGHNPLEPASWGRPVIFGNDMRDFALIADYLVAGGGALVVNNIDDLTSAMIQLLAYPDQAERMGRNALQVLKEHQGAVDRTLSFISITPHNRSLYHDPEERRSKGC